MRKHSLQYYRFVFLTGIIVAVSLATIGSRTFLMAQEQSSDLNIVYSPKLYEGLDYRMIGPYRGGRVTAVTGVPGNPPTLYFGSTGGGIWKTTNNGRNYQNVSDKYFKVGSIGAISVSKSHPNIIYVGTGSACIRSNVSTGRGVYKSTDDGETWNFIGLPEAGQIGKMVVHPEDPDLVYVAVLGHAFGPNSERGVYRSKDGGETWKQVLFVSDRTGAVDLSMNPGNPNEIYACMWRAERKPWTIISGGKEGGVYKTVNGGDTWTRLTKGLPEAPIGKTAVSVSPTNPKRVYVLVEAPGEKRGLYRSDNSGQHFSLINSQKSLMHRPFYYTHVTADPKDENTVYVNNEGFFRSVNAGSTFTRVRTPHGDNHDMWINPENTDFLFQANDGGANVSLDGGKSWSEQYNQATAELYHVVVDNQFPYWVYGEQQDNSTIRVPSLPPVASRLISPKQFWLAVAGCETGPLAVHPLKPHIVYGGCKGRFSRYNGLTGQEMQYWVYPHFNYGHAASEMPFRFQRTSPIEISPHNPDVIYHTSQYVHKTTDEGQTWEIISPDLTAKPAGTQGYSGEPITRDITGEEIYSTIYAFRESLHEEGVLWAGTNDGLVHISRDGGQNWKNITPPDLPSGGRVQTMEPSPHAPGRALVAIYRYMLDDWSPYIYKTEDYGTSWKRLTDGTNGIPDDYPTRVIREDPARKGLLYAGTEFGMFVSFDDGKHWQSLQLDLPATPITDIKVHHNDLVLSTMGRSFWILDDVTPLHQLNEKVASSSAYLFKPRDTYRSRWPSTRRRGDGATPEYPSNGVMIYYYLAKEGSEELIVDILDAAGDPVRSFSSDTTKIASRSDAEESFRRRPLPKPLSEKAGMHRFIWDMRYPDTAPLESLRAERGPLAVPGPYQVRLTIGDWSQTQNFELLIDPRVAADGVTVADLREQFDLNTRISDRISELRQAVLRIREVRSHLDSAATHSESSADIVAQAKSIRVKLTETEQALVQTEKGKVGAQLKPMLNRQLTYLYGMTTVADQKPGYDAGKRLEDIEKILALHLADLQDLLTEELPKLNIKLQARGLTTVK